MKTELGAAFAAMTMQVELPATARGGRPILVAVELTDPQQITDQVVVSYRREGEKHWSTVTAPAHTGMSRCRSGARSRPRAFRIVSADRPRPSSVGRDATPRGRPRSPARGGGRSGHGPRCPVGDAHVVVLDRHRCTRGGRSGDPILVDRSRDVGPQTVIIHSASMVVGRW